MEQKRNGIYNSGELDFEESSTSQQAPAFRQIETILQDEDFKQDQQSQPEEEQKEVAKTLIECVEKTMAKA